MSAKSAMENKMKMEDYIDHETIEVVNNIDDDDDDLIPHINYIDDDDDWISQLKPRKKKKKRTEKLDPNNSFEAEIIRQRMKRLADRLKALH